MLSQLDLLTSERIAAANGGGSFLVAWVFFLLLWSVPLLLVEFSMGKATRVGTVGAFARLAGRRFAWMGAWVAFTATAIMFYYSVVAGWTIRYFWAGVTGPWRPRSMRCSNWSGWQTSATRRWVVCRVGNASGCSSR